MAESEQIIRRYLLGELTESEQTALEEKYFTDRAAFERVLQVESELLDSYAREQLASDMREKFERSYMAHPSRRNRVKFATALATRLDQIHGPAKVDKRDAVSETWWHRLIAALRSPTPTLKLAMAFGLLLVVVGAAWLLIDNQRRRRDLAQTQAAREAQQRDPQPTANANAEAAANSSPGQTTQPTPNPPEETGPRSVTLALVARGVRGGDNNQVPTLLIKPATTQARLSLTLPENNYPTYQAALQTIAGAEVFSVKGIKSAPSKAGASFIVTVPTRKLSSGDYVLTLRGINPNGEVDDLTKSLFRVEKR